MNLFEVIWIGLLCVSKKDYVDIVYFFNFLELIVYVSWLAR